MAGILKKETPNVRGAQTLGVLSFGSREAVEDQLPFIMSGKKML